LRALIMAADGFGDSEFLYPYYRLMEEDIDVDIATPGEKDVEGKHGIRFEADLMIRGAETDAYDLLVVPGGRSPETLRMVSEAVEFVREFDALGKTIASICHGAQLLITAGAVDGSSATCYWSMMDDLENAGANVIDEAVVVDGNLVTSRAPEDLPFFMEKTVEKLERRYG